MSSMRGAVNQVRAKVVASAIAHSLLRLAIVFAWLIGSAIWLPEACGSDEFEIGRAEVISLPLNPADTKGYTVDFAWDQPTTPGYMVIAIRVTSTSTFAADRRLNLRLEPVELGHSPPQNGMTIDIPISIRQGDQERIVQRMVPKWSVGNGYQLRLFDEGSERENYGTEIGSLLRDLRRTNVDALYTDLKNDWLIISPDQDRDSVKRFVEGQFPIVTSQSNSRRVAQMNPAPVTRIVIPPIQLPTDWRELQSIDAVVIEAALLNTISSERPARYSALRQWMLCGGTIIVFNADSMASIASSLNVSDSGVEDGRKRILEESNSIQLKHQSEIAEYEEIIESINETTAAQTNGIGNELSAMSMSWMADVGSLQDYKDMLADIKRNAPDRMQRNRIWLTRAGAGQIVGLDSASRLDQFDLTLVALLFGYRQSPMLRRGVDPLLGDSRVSRWLIPGVAQPPVYTFIGLLTLFTILVGPVAYRKTTKQGRGYLMFAIAPALALLTTALMLIYGVVADGFGTQTRIRQVTWVDGESGDAGERIRGTYFAGVRPVDGISFAGNAEVMAYPDNNDESWESLNRLRDSSLGRIVITEDRQQFDSNFLPSRSQKQFVIHRPRLSLGRLKMVPPSTPAKTPSLSSEFDFQLRSVIVCDRDGNYWSAGSVPANASGVSCNRSTSRASSKLLGKMYNDYRPISPTREANLNSYSNRTRDLISVTNRATGDPSRVVTDGVFEFWLQQQLQVAGELPKGYFLALADVSDDAVWVQGAQSVASVRYVFGTLP